MEPGKAALKFGDAFVKGGEFGFVAGQVRQYTVKLAIYPPEQEKHFGVFFVHGLPEIKEGMGSGIEAVSDARRQALLAWFYSPSGVWGQCVSL
ncbi:hypothetical protein HEQ69_11360 [Haematospirillum jordaniae]|nr:hypothetical protein [Haematospirillum jordaniae]